MGIGEKKEPQTLRRRREEEKKRSVRREVFSWIRMFVIVIAVVFVSLRFIIINAVIPSGSMETTIMDEGPPDRIPLFLTGLQILSGGDIVPVRLSAG